ncbi:MAG: ThuA domain-containing protein [Planctomycetaceae bacterium]
MTIFRAAVKGRFETRWLAILLGLTLVIGVVEYVTAAERQKPARVLMVTQSKGFRHGSVNRRQKKLSPSEIAMTQLGQQTGLFRVDCTQDCAADFTAENLKNYQIVMFYTTGVLPIGDKDRDHFINTWLKTKGHGYIGFHSATDTYRTKDPKHRWYQKLSGGTFNGHPWNARNTVTITVHDTSHPAMKPFGKEFRFTDEIYQYVNWVPKNVHVLMSLNMAKCNPKQPYHVPVAWCRNWGQGKIYYNNLGHNEKTWTNPVFLKSTTAAVRWVLNLEKGDATPNPGVSAAEEKKAKAAAAK